MIALQAREWATAAREAWDSALKAGSDGLDAAGRLGGEAIAVFRSVDLDDDGVPDKPRALSAAENAGAVVAEAASAAARAAAGAASGVAGAIGSWFRRKPNESSESEDSTATPQTGEE